jgi:hypothetical protein
MNKKTITVWLVVLLLASSACATAAQMTVIGDGTTIRLNPSDNTYTTATTNPGTRFNVTVWIDNVANLGGAQVYLDFNDTILRVTRWFEPKNDPQYIFYGRTTSALPTPPNDPGYQHISPGKGRVLTTVVLFPPDPPYFTGSGKACIFEFNITKIPTEPGKFTSALHINTTDTFLLDGDGNEIQSVTKQDGYYEISKPEGPPPTFTLAVTSSTGGTTDPAPDVYVYPKGQEVSVQALPDSGYTFNYWELDGTNVGAANPVKVTMNQNHILNAVFAVIPPPPPPPPTGEFKVNWANYSTPAYPCGDPRYPFGGQFHDGEYPLWKNWTITNGKSENIIYISVRYPETSPAFKPSRYEIWNCRTPQCWKVNVDFEGRLVEFTAENQGILPGECAIVSIEFIEGPTGPECTKHEFAVTVSGKSCYSQTFYLKEGIDKTPPEVTITFPDAKNPGGMSYAFIKKADGYIWVQMPDCTSKNIGWLWINGTTKDACSGINRVEIWINGTYMGDATLSQPIGSNKTTSWWWFTDPTKNPRFWEHESWYYVVARAYDNSVNNEKTIPAHGSHPKIPKTNFKDTANSWFFWIGTETIVQLQDQPMPTGHMLSWVPGNGRVDVNGTTGFYPNGKVDIWLENELYGAKTLLTSVTADNYGRFYTVINHLPEVPRKPTCEDHWVIKAIDIKGNTGADRFAIIPWITYENTFVQNDAATWQTTKKGNVFDTFTVYGHGFLPSRQTRWDPFSTVYVRVVYTDVAPLEKWDARRVFNGTSQYNWDNLEWYPRLSEVVLAEVTTDANGYWSAIIAVPQSYGGLHAIYAYEYNVVTDPGMPGPRTSYGLVKSGWPKCTGVDKEEQAIIFDVWPTIAISPTTAISDQYVTITGEGLPLPKYYKLSKNGIPVVDHRDQCLVLDFGPFTQWIFENKRILNNELDFGWVTESWYPFSYYTPDIAAYTESPVWKGKLTSATVDFTTEKIQFHIGSKYLKVPMLPAGRYVVTIYYFDKTTESYVHDRDAKTSENVLKDPLHINVDVGKIHLPGEIINVFAQVDVDGMTADATSLALDLYKGETLVKSLDYSKIGEGSYVATFTCPSEAGDYFIRASATKQYEIFNLQGSAITGFTINPTINDINAKLVALEEKVATLETSLGKVKLDLEAVNGKVDSIKGTVATIVTDVGTLKTNVTSICASIVSLHDDVAVVHTKIGDLEVKLKDINGSVTIENDVATIKTDLGVIKGKVATLEGNTATIMTDLGTITFQAETIQGSIGLQPVTVGLSILAALATIAAAVLILRRVYLK